MRLFGKNLHNLHLLLICFWNTEFSCSWFIENVTFFQVSFINNTIILLKIGEIRAFFRNWLHKQAIILLTIDKTCAFWQIISEVWKFFSICFFETGNYVAENRQNSRYFCNWFAEIRNFLGDKFLNAWFLFISFHFIHLIIFAIGYKNMHDYSPKSAKLKPHD